MDYLIEQDSPFVKSYTFEHDVIPMEVKKKELVAERKRLLTQKERYEKELQFYKGLSGSFFVREPDVLKKYK